MLPDLLFPSRNCSSYLLEYMRRIARMLVTALKFEWQITVVGTIITAAGIAPTM